MYLNPESYQTLKSVKQELTRKKGKFVQTRSGGYRYIPSKEYTQMKTNIENRPKGVLPKGEFYRILVKSIQKLKNLEYAFVVAQKTQRRVSHVGSGKIILV